MSQGTLSAPREVLRLRGDRKSGHEGQILVIGDAYVKSSGSISAGDLTLRTIKAAVLSPQEVQPVRSGAPPMVYGSVIVAGSMRNYLQFRSFRSSIIPHTGTQHVGTARGGTMKFNFFIVGG